MSGCLQSLVVGTVFPIAEAASSLLLSRPTWSLSFPCCCPARRPHAGAGVSHPFHQSQSRSSSSALLWASPSWDLASVRRGYAAAPCSAASPGASLPPARGCFVHPVSRVISPRSRARGPLLGRGSTASSIRCISKHDFHLSVSRHS